MGKQIQKLSTKELTMLRISSSQRHALVQLYEGPVCRHGMNGLQLRTFDALIRKGLAGGDSWGYWLDREQEPTG